MERQTELGRRLLQEGAVGGQIAGQEGHVARRHPVLDDARLEPAQGSAHLLAAVLRLDEGHAAVRGERCRAGFEEIFFQMDKGRGKGRQGDGERGRQGDRKTIPLSPCLLVTLSLRVWIVVGKGSGLNIQGRGEHREGAGETTMGSAARLVAACAESFGWACPERSRRTQDKPSRSVAGEGDEGLGGPARQQAQHLQLGGVKFVEAVHDQERQVGIEGGVALQSQRGQPALPLGIGPAAGHQPVLVGGVDGGQFGQARGLVGDGSGETVAVDAGAFQLLDEGAQAADEAGLIAQGGIVAQAALVAETIHDGPQQPVLDGVVEAGGKAASAGQHVGVETVEGADLDTEGSAGASQTAAETGHLGEVGQDDPDRGKRSGGPQPADAGDGVGGLAAPGWGKEHLGRHLTLHTLTFRCTLFLPYHQSPHPVSTALHRTLALLPA